MDDAPFDVSMFSDPAFQLKTLERDVVKDILTYAKAPKTYIYKLYDTHRARTGEKGLAIADLLHPDVHFPADVRARILSKQNVKLSHVFSDFHQSPLIDLWTEELELDPNWGPKNFRALVFRVNTWGVVVMHDMLPARASFDPETSEEAIATLAIGTKYGNLFIDSLKHWIISLNWQPVLD